MDAGKVCPFMKVTLVRRAFAKRCQRNEILAL